MADLGTFAAARREADGEPDTFTLCGETFRVEAPGSLPFLEFSVAAASGVDSEDPAGAAALYSMLHDCVHDEDWPKFRQVCHSNRIRGDTLMEIVKVVVETQSGRPTTEPSDSAAGPPPTGTGSKQRRPSRVNLDDRRRQRAKSAGMKSVDELLADSR